MRNKTLKEKKGITLIALVITIIVLLILAGVSISMLTSENGIITQAQNAKEETEIASEKEAIQLTMINREMTGDEKYNIGEELRDRTLANGDNWKIVSVNDTKQIYGTDCYYVGTGVSLESYGETKHEWVINYNTGEVIELPEEGFIKLAYGENLAVTDGIILNADPINMENGNSWGNGVTVHGIQEGDGYGWNETEFKLDGVDDYIEVYPQAGVNIENGFTFEFYGKNLDTNRRMPMLSKSLPDVNKVGLRSYMDYKTIFNMSMGLSNIETGSDWQNPNLGHWMNKDIEEDFSQGGYITVSVDLNKNEVTIYKNGDYFDSTICNKEWLNESQIMNNEIPFLIAKLYSYGEEIIDASYAKVDIYACRLYNKILTADEVKANYDKTVAYHNVLVQSKN